jgi:hypothetical protein
MPNIGKKELYIRRHGTACAELHFNIREEIGVKLQNEHWYKHVPKLTETSHEGKVTTLWNQQARTDSTIPISKPDIIIRHHEMEHVC